MTDGTTLPAPTVVRVGADDSPASSPSAIVRVEFEDGSAPLDIDVDALTWEDMELLESSRADSEQVIPYATIADIMKRLCPTGYKKLSVRRDTRRFFVAIGKAMQAASDPNA